MALEREEVVVVAGAVFVAALAVFYGFMDTDILTESEAFYVAAVSWFVAYAGCGGRDWSEAEDWHVAIFGVSWLILLVAHFTTRLDDFMMEYEPWLQVTAIAVHSLSFFIISREGLR